MNPMHDPKQHNASQGRRHCLGAILLLNLFDRLPLEPKPGDCQLIIKHLYSLCGEDDGLFHWVCCWLALPLQKLGTKMRTSLIIYGRMEGTGKSFMMDIMRRIWTSDQPVDYEGRFYRVKNARSEIKPYQQPHPALLFGGSSPEALDMGAQFCDRFAMFGEPLKETADTAVLECPTIDRLNIGPISTMKIMPVACAVP